MSAKFPLAAYEGERPPAPKWFLTAIETPSLSRELEVDGTRISYRQWGSAEKPGLLFVHGNGAHENWYDFIAPEFRKDFNAVAMTFSGMGESEWRDTYSRDRFSAEIVHVMQDAEMFGHESKPIIAAHSFGGVIALAAAAKHGDRINGVAIMDTPIFPPNTSLKGREPRTTGPDKFYPDLKTALGRFRLMPPQTCENHCILDHIARHSLKRIDRNGAQGWTWKFDPTLWQKMGYVDDGLWELVGSVPCRLAFMRGENSNLVTDTVRDNMLQLTKEPFISIENADHHLFLDNPLDTIAELKKVFKRWND